MLDSFGFFLVLDLNCFLHVFFLLLALVVLVQTLLDLLELVGLNRFLN